MRNVFRNCILYFVFCIASVAARGAVPPINVSVLDGGGKVVFKGVTNATGAFETAKFKSGDYVVKFTSSDAGLKANRYTLAISAGTARVLANAIAGQRFAGLGVAMKITIGMSVRETLKKYPSLNNPAAIRAMEQGNREANTSITGQVTAER